MFLAKSESPKRTIFAGRCRIDIRRIAAIKSADRIIGNHTRAKVVKNKLAAPFREAEFDLIYGEGICRETDLLDLGVAQGLVEKSGAWFALDGERIGQGRENTRQFLRDHPDVCDRLEATLREKLGLPGTPTPAVPTAPAAPAAPEGPAHGKSR